VDFQTVIRAPKDINVKITAGLRNGVLKIYYHRLVLLYQQLYAFLKCACTLSLCCTPVTVSVYCQCIQIRRRLSAALLTCSCVLQWPTVLCPKKWICDFAGYCDNVGLVLCDSEAVFLTLINMKTKYRSRLVVGDWVIDIDLPVCLSNRTHWIGDFIRRKTSASVPLTEFHNPQGYTDFYQSYQEHCVPWCGDFTNLIKRCILC